MSSACTVVLDCQNGGLFNNKTCACQCYPAYTGNICEFENCNNEPAICSTEFSKDSCAKNKEIMLYCPKLCDQPICKCGFSNCTNGGTFVSESCKCDCIPPFYGYRCNLCPALKCLNGGTFNSATCKCDCNILFDFF